MAFKYAQEYKLYEKEQKLDNRYYQQQQKQLNTWNQESAQKQMDFQKMMSDTSHQREVNDLLKAGLNPVLSANNGASTPSGAYANVDSTPMSSAAQSRNANRQMRQQMIQNKMQLANAMAIAKYQAQMQYAAQKYATDMSYQLGLAGLSNQLTIAGLPYQEGNVNQTTKYQVDSNPAAVLTNMLMGFLKDAYGESKGTGAKDFGGAIAKLIFANPESSWKTAAENSKNTWTQPLSGTAAQMLSDYFASKTSAKNYNISKKDWLKSLHEYAKGNWSYQSEKWKRDQGYKYNKYNYYK